LFPIETGPQHRLFFGQNSEKARDYYLKFDKASLQLDQMHKQQLDSTSKVEQYYKEEQEKLKQ
jgi:hypothetical protein